MTLCYFKRASIPDRTSLSSLSMLGEGTLDRGLPGREHSDPPSALKESSLLSIRSSLTHLWQTLCWHGKMRGCVKSSLHIGQMSSRSMFLMGPWKTTLNSLQFHDTASKRLQTELLVFLQLKYCKGHSNNWRTHNWTHTQQDSGEMKLDWRVKLYGHQWNDRLNNRSKLVTLENIE